MEAKRITVLQTLIPCAKDILLASNTGDLFIEINMSKENKEDRVYRKRCEGCGCEFETLYSFKKFCSGECRTAYHNNNQKLRKKVYNKICPICKEPFSTTDKRKVFCGEKCRRRDRKNKEKEERRKIMNAARKVCPTCGKVFKPNVHNQVFCSKKCLYKANYKEYKSSIMHEFEKTCPTCGKHFMASKRVAIYCSPECRNKDFAIKNKEALKEYKKRYREENREHITKHLKEYCEKHKDELRVRKRAYVRNRSKKDPVFRMRSICRAMVRRCLTNKKKDKTQIILGYSPKELKEHLESLFYGDMCWEVLNWEIHHIRPLETFNFINEDGTDNYEAVREANVLDNLMPLFKEDHKKLTLLYNSEKKWLSEEEIKDSIITGEICSMH